MADDISKYLESAGTVDKSVEAAIEADLKKDINLEAKYGDSPVEAGLGEAAATATFGASDVLARAAGVSAERLRETRERSPVATGFGTAAGIIVPALASGGESLVAKALGSVVPAETASIAAKTLGATALPMEAASGAGKLASQGIEKLLEGRVRQGAIKEILKGTAQGATEGALFGAGDAIDEMALGKADVNAQNLVAGAGAGAMLGGLAGGAFGGAKATVPLVSKGIEPITSKLASAAKNLVDPEVAAQELVGLTPSKFSKLEKYHPTLASDLPDYLVTKLELSPTTSAESLLTKNAAVKAEAGNRIGVAVEQLDNAANILPETLPTRFDAAARLQSKLDDIAGPMKLTSGSNKAELEVIAGFEKDVNKLAAAYRGGGIDAVPLTELDQIRKNYQKIKFKGGGAVESFRADVANTLRAELRNIIDETATKISSNSLDPSVQALANDLKAANKDYSMASTLERSLPSKINKSTALSLTDLIRGGAVGTITHSTPLGIATLAARQFAKSDLRRNLAVLADIKAQNMAIKTATKEAIGNFIKKSGRPLRQLGYKSMLNSGFAINYDTKQPPKNSKQAYQNAAQNLHILATDPEAMTDRLAKATARISGAAPGIAQETQNTLVRSVQFLASKVPQDPAPAGVFPREYQPSSIEIAKFERYMQAVEHPISVLEDLQNGTLTREHVEALQAVYPSMYQDLRQEALDQSLEPDAKLSYNKKIQLGILLDVPTDRSLVPVNIAGLQANFMPQNDPMQVEAQQGAMRQGNQSGLQKLDSASRATTETQRIEGRKA